MRSKKALSLLSCPIQKEKKKKPFFSFFFFIALNNVCFNN